MSLLLNYFLLYNYNMKNNLPEQIPIFPLNGVIFFPKTNLPLNIFEERYLNLVNDCFKNNKLMGLVQSKRIDQEVYDVGCLGKINEFEKSPDGRILVNLTGVTRFEIIKEIKSKKLYREFEVKYKKFEVDISDIEQNSYNDNDIRNLVTKTKNFFKKNGLLINWLEFEKMEHNQQINTLAMIAPISNEEKQKLLETVTISDKTKTFSKIIEFYLHSFDLNKLTIQ
jgi:Lon protease-like protein